jgi:hypothetical protein
MIRFNTRALYTEDGQRIAAIAIDGGVYMVDVDRNLHYFYDGCALTESDIMRRYNSDSHTAYEPPSISANKWEGYNELNAKLQDYAMGAPSLKVNKNPAHTPRDFPYSIKYYNTVGAFGKRKLRFDGFYVSGDAATRGIKLDKAYANAAKYTIEEAIRVCGALNKLVNAGRIKGGQFVTTDMRTVKKNPVTIKKEGRYYTVKDGARRQRFATLEEANAHAVMWAEGYGEMKKPLKKNPARPRLKYPSSGEAFAERAASGDHFECKNCSRMFLPDDIVETDKGKFCEKCAYDLELVD